MIKRSPIGHRFNDPAIILGEMNGYSVPLSVSDKEIEIECTKQLALCDLTAFNRVGFRGGNINTWAEEQHNIVLPEANRSLKTQQGFIVARLSHTEILILDDIEDQRKGFTSILKKTGHDSLLKYHPDIYYLPRQDSHSCFMLSGEHCAAMFSKLCAVDLRVSKFSNMSVAQTSMARASVIIIRWDFAETPGYFVLMDSSLAEYLWNCLLDAMQEFDGKIIGCSTLTYTPIEFVKLLTK